jgi:predicted nucleic acid-binding protein
MIYFDTAYVVKCYLPEPGFGQVRSLLNHHQSAACCIFGRLEFTAAIQRAVRERRLHANAVTTIQSILAADDDSGLWNWLPLTTALLESAAIAIRMAPVTVAIRAADALHLVSARESGCGQIYTNDRHVIAAAPHFGMQAINIIKAINIIN